MNCPFDMKNRMKAVSYLKVQDIMTLIPESMLLIRDDKPKFSARYCNPGNLPGC